MPPPDLALHIVLKKNCRNARFTREVHGSIEKIANHNIEIALCIIILQPAAYLGTSETRHSIRYLASRLKGIIQAPPEKSVVVLSRAQTDRSWKFALQRALVFRISLIIVIRQKGKLMFTRQLPRKVVRANVPPALHRQQLVGLYPEYSHRSHTTLRPVIKLAKATAAAMFSTTNVYAASATRASGPELMRAKARSPDP